MKKESLASKAPEKSILEVSNGSPLLLSETIIRTSKKGIVYLILNSVLECLRLTSAVFHTVARLLVIITAVVIPLVQISLAKCCALRSHCKPLVLHIKGLFTL